jgi:hypothetical protein
MASPLRYPTKVLIHHGHLFIADTGNDRILIFDREGEC